MSKFSSSNQSDPFKDKWDMDAIIDWISSNKQIIIGVLVGLFLVLIASYRYLSQKDVNAEINFLKAETLFTEFQENNFSNPVVAREKLKELDELFKKYPDLQVKYDGALAQSLLLSNQIPQSSSYMKAIFNRVQPDHLQLYQQYSQNSLIIGGGDFTKALQDAQDLKKTMDTSNSIDSHPILYLLNLIRIAVLQDQLGQKQEEAHAWKLIETHLASYPNDQVNQAFKVGNTSLEKYMKTRKLSIQQSYK